MTKEKRAAGNKVLPKAGLNSFDWAFVQGSTAVIRLNFCAKNPAFGNTQTVGCKFFWTPNALKFFPYDSILPNVIFTTTSICNNNLLQSNKKYLDGSGPEIFD